MSWWETGKERLKIGDVPADRIGSGLKKIAAARHQDQAAAPKLRQLVSALQQALDLKGSDRVAVKTSRGTLSAAGPDDPLLETEVGKIVRAVNQAYQEELEREATPEEILACFAFVLGYKPEIYLSDVEGDEVEDITLASGPDSQFEGRSQ